MAQNWHNEYADRKNNRKPVSYAHNDLVDILEPTYGLIIYQEQLMRVAQRLAGYSLEEADNLRKDEIQCGSAAQDAAHEVAVDVLVNQQPNHRLGGAPGIAASHEASAHTNWIEARLDLVFQCLRFVPAFEQICVDVGRVVEIVRDDQVDIR